MSPRLIVFGGLPGTGKTTVSRQIAYALGAVYLRVDSIEQALLRGTPDLIEVGGGGYAVAVALASDNLAAGLAVVVDSVNPLRITRDMFRSCATNTGAHLIEIEVVCSDPVEHRRRVESRAADIPGHRLPTWNDVVSRPYDLWDRPVRRFDTAHRPAEVVVRDILAAIS